MVSPEFSSATLSDSARRLVTGESHGDGMILGNAYDADTVQAVISLLNLVGIGSLLNKWAAEDLKGPGGRPAYYQPWQILVLLILNQLNGHHCSIEQIAYTAQYRLNTRARKELGVPDARTETAEIVYDRIHNGFARLIRIIDPYGGVASRECRTWKEVWASWQKATGDKEHLERRQARMRELVMLLLQSSYRLIPRADRRKAKGNYVLDSTCVPVFGRNGNPKREGQIWTKDMWSEDATLSPEPMAGWYWHSTTDHSDQHQTPKREDEPIYSYEMHVLETIGNLFEFDKPCMPNVVVGLWMERPAGDPGGNGWQTFQGVLDYGLPRGVLVADRAYLFNPVPESFQKRLFQAGFGVCGDYKNTASERGIQATYRGMVLIDGNLYSPAIRGYPDLVDPRAGRKGDLSHDEWDEIVRRRQRFLMQLKEVTPNGDLRFVCPARGPYRKISCPLVEFQQTLAKKNPLPIPASKVPKDGKGGLPVPCRQGSVTVKTGEADDVLKYLQTYQYQGPEWRCLYSHRNFIEARNRYSKQPKGGDVDDPDQRRMRGWAAQFLVLSIHYLVQNLTVIRDFYHPGRNQHPEQVLLARRRRPKRQYGGDGRRKRGPVGDRPPAVQKKSRRKKRRAPDRR